MTPSCKKLPIFIKKEANEINNRKNNRIINRYRQAPIDEKGLSWEHDL